MSVLTYPPTNENDIFKYCVKECGIITASEDQQFYALGCLFCTEKFLYFDAFIGHMQTEHTSFTNQHGVFGGNYIDNYEDTMGDANTNSQEEEEDLTDTDPALLEPQMVMIKEELIDDDQQDNDILITGFPSDSERADVADALFSVKQEHSDVELSATEFNDQSYSGEGYGNYEDYDGSDGLVESEEQTYNCEDEGVNYDDLVEESLLGETGLTMHIKDRKMIKFLIDSYRRNAFLWDHRHAQFRDRVKRQQFLEWIVIEFKRRFNISLAKDAVTRKWDNLRTVYKRECNRMAQEKTNVSTLWYFKELHFLNRLYGGNQKISEAVVKETVYRRRYSALWNDVSTNKLLRLVEQYHCFYDKYHMDYRSKEKRGEALQMMAHELQKMIDVTTIQISKRISQLRFDYSKQKQERLQCEQANKVFVPSYSYYDQMFFMDADIAPFKCELCSMILQTPREIDVHMFQHQSDNGYVCPVCNMSFNDVALFSIHKQRHHNTATKEAKYHCDLCTASFREKSNYDEHIRRHNDELFLPSLENNFTSSSSTSNNKREKPFQCNHCGKSFSSNNHLKSHKALHHSNGFKFKCDYPHCNKTFAARQSFMEHTKLHYSDEEYKCETCGKGFKSVKNLQNHKQIHDAIKKYICKICGSAFAQAAGLYLHKRRHNRPNSRIRHSH